MKKCKRVLLHLIILKVFSFMPLFLFGNNAPVSTIASVVNAIPGEQVTVPVTVNGFNNIGGFTLALDYEYAKLHFVSGSKNSLLGGTCNIGEIDLGNGFHRLTISWYNSVTSGVSLPDGSSIVDYVFTFISGPATLTWYDMGPSCVYNDPLANTLVDTPESDYYFNGLISDSALPKPSITANGPITFFEGEKVTLTSSTALSYLWSTGDTTSSIIVNKSGIYTVQTKNIDGLLSECSDPIEVSVILIGSTGLNFCLANANIIKDKVNKFYEFDILVKADNPGTFLWNGQIHLNFENKTLSSKIENWTLIPDSLFVSCNSLGLKKYRMDLSINGSTLSFNYKGNVNAKSLAASEKNYVEITNNYQTLVSIRGLIIAQTGVAGIEFSEDEMNGKQFYRISEFPWYESYANMNKYDRVNFIEISDLLTEIEEETVFEETKIYINSDKQIIILGNVEEVGVAKIYNMHGRLIKSKKLNSGYDNRISVSEIKSGIYILVIGEINKKQSFKVSIIE